MRRGEDYMTSPLLLGIIIYKEFTMNWFHKDEPEENLEKPIELALREEFHVDGRTTLSPMGKNPTSITKENASEMAHRRWDKARQQAREGMKLVVEERLANGTLDKLKYTGDDSWKLANAHAFEVYLKTDSARGLAELGNFLGKNSGDLPDPVELKNMQEPEKVKETISDAMLIIAAYEYYDAHKKELMSANVIDAEVKDLVRDAVM
jgi:hypothetical protein